MDTPSYLPSLDDTEMYTGPCQRNSVSLINLYSFHGVKDYMYVCS